VRRLSLIDPDVEFFIFLELRTIFGLLHLDERLVRELDAPTFAFADGLGALDQLIVALDAKLSADGAVANWKSMIAS
jgi:hypothetical protein